MRKSFREIIAFSILAVIGISLLALVIGGSGMFVSENKAIHALETQGFSDVKITDRAVFFLKWRGGDKSDSVRFTAIAKNPAGKEVEVYVFAGFWKGATIRTP